MIQLSNVRGNMINLYFNLCQRDNIENGPGIFHLRPLIKIQDRTLNKRVSKQVKIVLFVIKGESFFVDKGQN